MPGLLKRTHDQVDAAAEDEAAETPSRKRVALEQANGDGGVSGSANGTYAVPAFSTDGITSDQELTTEAQALATDDDAPELHHVTEGYVSLGVLVSRLAQETHNDLEALILELAEMQATQMNGYGSAQSVQVNVRKKERLFNFAHKYRTKFIKLLVLSQWSRDSQAVSKLIDLNNWIMYRKEEYRNSVAWMGELRRMLGPMQIPAPDLRTALEVLSTGKASWISDLGYIPQEPLTSSELLRALRTINTLLMIRLNLDENIPEEMMDFTVHSGRATFRVKDEFEIDLSIADEDPSSQLYFIDFRFQISPCKAEIPDGPIRKHLEGKTNAILKTEGLQGCYKFLHDFALTHKLSTLRIQALELAKGLWSGSIRVEQVRRGLVVQYWINRPGPKNWVEIGVRKRRRKAGDAHESDAPHLAVRWYSHGKEVSDHGVEVGSAELSLERILKDVIARHVNSILKDTKRKLKQGDIYRKELLSVKHRSHPTEPAASCLNIQTTLDKTITVTQDQVSGFFSIAPASAMHHQTEIELNQLRLPAADAGTRLALLRCNEVLAQVQTRARMRRWLSVQTYRPNMETIERLFKSAQVRLAFYKLPGWDRTWLLALTTSLDGDKWWIVESQDAPRNPTPMDYVTEAYQPLKRSLRVNLDHDMALIFDPSYQALSLVERSSAAVLSQYADARELTSLKVAYRQVPPRKTSAAVIIPDLFIHMPLRLPLTRGRSQSQWCCDIVRSTFAGLSRKERVAVTIVTGRLTKQIPHIERFAASMDAGLAFHPSNGQFAFRLKTRIGQPSVTELQQRFDRISTLVQFINATTVNNLYCIRIALDALTFSYVSLDRDPAGADPNILQATIGFPPDKPLSLSLPEGNPHLRIADSLTQILNDPDSQGLQQVIAQLRVSLSLLRGFTQLERDTSGPYRVAVSSRSASYFVMRYSGPKAGFAYHIMLRYRTSDSACVAWLFNFEWKPPLPALLPSTGDPNTEEADKSKSTDKDSPVDLKKSSLSKPKPAAVETKRHMSELDKSRAAVLRTAWETLCKERQNGRWMGLKTGICSETAAARACLLHVDATMRSALAEAEALESPSSSDGGKTGAETAFKAESSLKGKAGAESAGKAAAASNAKNSASAALTKNAPSRSSSGPHTPNDSHIYGSQGSFNPAANTPGMWSMSTATAPNTANPTPVLSGTGNAAAKSSPAGAAGTAANLNGARQGQLTPGQRSAMEAMRMKGRPQLQWSSSRGESDVITLD